MAYFEINGVIPPMATPFTAEGDVDYTKFVDNIHQYNDCGLAGYLVLGSNSETPYLTEEEKLELVRLTVEHSGKDQFVMVGSGMESTRETITLTNKAADLGADCALIITPNFFDGAMKDEALLDYYTTIADNVRIPILIYNVTKFTHVNISPRAVGILSKHPNIIGMKDSSGDIAQLISMMNVGLGDEFNLMVGTAATWYPALCIGLKGGVMALADCCPRECVEVHRLYQQGKLEESFALYRKMFPINAVAVGKLGVPGLKYAMDLCGFGGGAVRSPLQPVTAENKKIIEALF